MLVFCAAAFHAEAAFYLRPTGQVISFTDDSIDTDVGYGGGVALGGAFGKEQRFEIGADLTTSTNGAELSRYEWVSPGHLVRHPIDGEIRTSTFLATFRYCFKARTDAFRPFLDLALGFSYLRFDEGAESGDGTCWRAGLGGGVSCRLGRLTRVDLGYRYLLSDSVADFILVGSYGAGNFRPTAHIFTIALDQRF